MFIRRTAARPQYDLDHIHPIVPARDGDHQGNTSSTEPGGVVRNRLTRHSNQPAAMSALHFWARLTAIVALVAGIVACVWVWQLQGHLQLANDQMANYATRIADLAARLSDTDVGMNQNAAALAVKVATVATEVLTLWDNVWE